MELFDSHLHIYNAAEPREFLQNCLDCAAVPPQSGHGVPDKFAFMVVSGNIEESRTARQFAEALDDCWFGAGVHPHCAAECSADTAVAEFAQFVGHPKLKCVGELGLDYYYDNAPRATQIEMFGGFLELALAHRLPAVVHLRDKDGESGAYSDGFELLRPFAERGGRFVVHCFSGTASWAEKFLELGAFIGVTGMITFSRADNVRAALRVVPDQRLLIETDSPYLAPTPHRGEQNHPGFLALTAGRLAAERGMDFAELAALTSGNARKFFNLP